MKKKASASPRGPKPSTTEQCFHYVRVRHTAKGWVSAAVGFHDANGHHTLMIGLADLPLQKVVDFANQHGLRIIDAADAGW